MGVGALRARIARLNTIWTFVLLGVLILWDIYGLDFMPFLQIFGDTPWAGIAYHFVSGMSSVFFIWLLCPSALQRFVHRPAGKNFLIGAGVVLIVASSFFNEVAVPGFSIWKIMEAILFCLGIGFGEEFYSRGLVFGLFERFGLRWAIGVSSIEFGLSHFTNMIWGGQDFAQTAAQALNASAFGFLAVCLMLYTGNIWFGVVMHGLSDYSLVSTPHSQYVANLTGPVNWFDLAVTMSIYIAIGAGLLFLHRGRLLLS